MCRCLKTCYPNEIASITWNNPEEMCLFEISDSSLESHMPQTVLNALGTLKKQIEEGRSSEWESDHLRQYAQESDLPQKLDDGIELWSVKVSSTEPLTEDIKNQQTQLTVDAEVHC